MAAPPPEFVEVRCAGCGETLEVDPGLTEFACPDCGTHQALPPELMPPPPRRPRRALPIPGRGPASAVPVPVPSRMPCEGCGAVLSVLAGIGRFACPLCSVELVIDDGRLRLCLDSQDSTTVSVVAPPPAGATPSSPYTRRRQEVQVERHDHSIRSEMLAQRPSLSVNTEETPSSLRADTRMTIHTMLAQKEHPNHSVYRAESRIGPPNTTSMMSITRKPRLQAGTESIIGLEKVQPEPPIQASYTPQAQARPLSYSFCSDHTQGQHPVVGVASHQHQRNDVCSTMEQKNIDDPSDEALNAEQTLDKYQCKTIEGNPKRKQSIKSANGKQKGENKGLTSYPNDGLHLRRSKRFTKQSEYPGNSEPAQQSDASSNENDTDQTDIDRIIADLCPSSLPPHEMPQARSNESDNIEATILETSSNHCMPQVEQFPHCYSQLYPPEDGGRHQLDKSGKQVWPQSPEVMDVQQVWKSPDAAAYSEQALQEQEGAHCGNRLLGSDRKSSGKRRGRPQNCPTRLIAPRREADRPILTPNNIDNWDVNPPCPKVASTLTILMKQKHPGSTYLLVDQNDDVPLDGEVVHHWHQYPPEMRAAVLNEFLQRYKWAPGREADCLKLFERRAVRQFAGILWEEKRRVRGELASIHKAKETSGAHRSNRRTEVNNEDAREELEDQQIAARSEDDDPLQWKPYPPAWLYPNWWERLCEHWAKEEVLMMSSQNRKNRRSGGRAFHTTGSRSLAMHRQLMVMENGGELVSELEVFNKTHKLNGGTGEFISERAKRTVEGFKKRMEEAGDKDIDPNLAWVQEVGGQSRRGRYYGLTGIVDKAKVDELAKSVPGCSGEQGQEQKFTQEQAQQMINEALQGFNEAWEIKFKSLEQSVYGMPLLGVHPEHGPGSSASGGAVQEDRSADKVSSGSQHGERCPSERHGDNNNDEEAMSTSV